MTIKDLAFPLLFATLAIIGLGSGVDHSSSAPAVCSLGSDQEHVFYRGENGQLMHVYWTLKDGWTSQAQNMGAPSVGFEGAPAALSRSPSVLNVYVLGNDKKIWTRSFSDGRWHDWAALAAT
jgi:hypothetical protein